MLKNLFPAMNVKCLLKSITVICSIHQLVEVTQPSKHFNISYNLHIKADMAKCTCMQYKWSNLSRKPAFFESPPTWLHFWETKITMRLQNWGERVNFFPYYPKCPEVPTIWFMMPSFQKMLGLNTVDGSAVHCWGRSVCKMKTY